MRARAHIQMVSLSKLMRVTEEGVEFESPHEPHDLMLLTPERCIEIQEAIGADIIMQVCCGLKNVFI